MTDSNNIRWKQRFDNYEKALNFLVESAQKEDFTPLEQAGLVQAFEFTFELAWKTLKDYLNAQGLSLRYPREVIKEAFQTGLIADGETWLDMLDSRNLMSHTYQTEDSIFVFQLILKNYVTALTQMSRYFNAIL